MPTCRPGSSVLDGLQPETSATRRKWPGHIHIAASSVKPLRGARHQRFGTGTTSDRTPGPRAGTSPCHCPIADHTDSSVPCTPQTVHRGTVNVGTWNVRGLKVQKHVHKPVDVSLTLTSKDITVCAIKNLAGPRNRHRHDSRVQLCRDCWVQLRLDPVNRVPDQTRCHGLRYAAAGKGKSLIKPHGSD
jgi:hypothetical protein